MTIQSDYQKQIEQNMGIGSTDDNAILSLSADDIAGAKEIVGNKEPESTPAAYVESTGDEGNAEPGSTAEPETSYSKEQVQAIVRNRVATYEKRLEKLKSAEAAVDKIAEVSGLTKDQLITRLNTMSDIEQAKLLGVSPEQVAGMRAARASQVQNENQIKKLNRELEMTQLKSDKRYSDIDLFMDDILAKVEDHPSLSLKDAYTLVKGEVGITAQIRDAEQRAINSQAAAKSKTLVNPVGGAQVQPKRMSSEVVNAANKVGMDPNEYVAFQNIDNIDAYRAWKKQKGK